MNNPYNLTPRQQEVVELAITGMNNTEIADQLGISPKTVSNTLYQAYPKLGVPNRTAAAFILSKEVKENG